MEPRKRRLSKAQIIAAAVLLLMIGKDSIATEKKSQLTFRQNLEAYGFSLHYRSQDDIMRSFVDLAFLSNDLLLVSEKEIHMGELHPRVLPGGTLAYDNPTAAHTSPDSLSPLLLFSVGQKKLVRSAKFPVQKREGTVQATQRNKFLMLSSHGLQLCSAELQCGPPTPADGHFFVSPRGSKALIAEPRFGEQRLVSTDTLAVLERYKPRAPAVIPGDSGVLLTNHTTTAVRMPGKLDVDLGLSVNPFHPEFRFLNDDKVIGIRMNGTKGRAAIVKVDGSPLYDIAVEDALRGNTRFFTSASGERFGIAELYYTRINSIINFFDINDSRAYNRKRIRVFDVGTGKQVFELQWDPRGYRGESILPALSADGRRLAVVRAGELQVYELF